jgi:GrpB-like predicted nucleotidyltransferase (UPF0157 family)
MTEPLGLQSGAVVVRSYDQRWPRLFEAEAARLKGECDGLGLRFEHVGSTAVPGMPAKPVLDLAAGRPEDTRLGDCIMALQRAGYEHRGEQGVPGREFFRRGQPRAYHVHLVDLGGRLWRQYLGFRDYLRGSPDAAKQYAKLKLALAARFPWDREAYIAGKAQFVEALLRQVLGAA